MRAVLWIVALGCGGTPVAPPSNAKRQPDVAPPKPNVVEDCDARTSGHDPGNHDRYAFEDPSGKFGFKDKAGKVVIPAIYVSVYEFSPGGLAGVTDPAPSAPSPVAFIDPAGKLVAHAFLFDNGPDYFQEGLARIVDDKQRVGFIDERGTIVIAPKFTRASPFCHGASYVELGLDKYFIDRAGKPRKPPPDAADYGAGDSGG